MIIFCWTCQEAWALGEPWACTCADEDGDWRNYPPADWDPGPGTRLHVVEQVRCAFDWYSAGLPRLARPVETVWLPGDAPG